MAKNTQVVRAAAGQKVVVPVGPDASQALTLKGGVTLSKKGNDLVVQFDNGELMTLPGYYRNFGYNVRPPTMTVLDDEESLAALNNPELMPAIDPIPGPSPVAMMSQGAYQDAVLANAGIAGDADGLLGALGGILQETPWEFGEVWTGGEADAWYRSTEYAALKSGALTAAAPESRVEDHVPDHKDDFPDHNIDYYEIYGTDGNDIIYGLGGNDTIYGGDGNDIIYGGGGNNTIYGLGGDDIFAWILKDAGSGKDTIHDFKIGDMLQFDDLVKTDSDLDDLLSSIAWKDGPGGKACIEAEVGGTTFSLILDADRATLTLTDGDTERTIDLRGDFSSFSAPMQSGDAAGAEAAARELFQEIIRVA